MEATVPPLRAKSLRLKGDFLKKFFFRVFYPKMILTQQIKNREYEVERVQLELLDLGQELLKLRSQVNCIEMIIGRPMIMIIIMRIFHLNVQGENRGQSRSASLASLVAEGGEPAVLLALKLSGAQVVYQDIVCFRYQDE